MALNARYMNTHLDVNLFRHALGLSGRRSTTYLPLRICLTLRIMMTELYHRCLFIQDLRNT